MEITNKILIRDIPNLSKFKAEAEELYNQLCQIDKKLGEAREYIELLEDVTEVFEGVPLHIWESSTIHIHQVLEHDRWANVYLNRHNDTTYGVNIKADDWATDKHLGYNFKQEEALLIAKRWVAHGVLPTEPEV